MSGNSHQRRKNVRAKVIPRMKAVVDDTICGNGVYWCMHEFDNAYPWVWVDFRFPSLKHPKRIYYACAMRTLEYARLNEIQDAVYDKFSSLNEYSLLQIYNDSELVSKFKRYREEVDSIVETDVALMSPSITLKDYRDGAIGVHCTVNTPYIDDKVIRDFIQHFRSLGEPTTDGYTWHGQKTQVEPKHLRKNEYGKCSV